MSAIIRLFSVFRFSVFSLLLQSLFLTGMTDAFALERFVEGKDYVVIKPAVKTQMPVDTISIIEFFSYTCPHCYSLEKEAFGTTASGAAAKTVMSQASSFKDWKEIYQRTQTQKSALKKLDLQFPVSFRRMHARFGSKIYQDMAHFHTVLTRMNLSSKRFEAIHKAVFEEIHLNPKKRLFLRNKADQDALLKEHGLLKKFQATEKKMKEFGEVSKLKQEVALYNQYKGKLTGVPAFVVNGRYLISPKGGLYHLFDTIDFLIKKEDRRLRQLMDKKSKKVNKKKNK